MLSTSKQRKYEFRFYQPQSTLVLSHFLTSSTISNLKKLATTKTFKNGFSQIRSTYQINVFVWPSSAYLISIHRKISNDAIGKREMTRKQVHTVNNNLQQELKDILYQDRLKILPTKWYKKSDYTRVSWVDSATSSWNPILSFCHIELGLSFG